jgi:nucleotide-binding universal stress UspA family protein
MGAIVLGYDDSPGARNALAVAIDLADSYGDRLVVAFGAAPPVSSVGEEWKAHKDAVEEIGKRATDAALDQARQAGVEAEVALVPERPSEALIRLAGENDARFIVVGSRGEGPIKGALLGSTSHKLVHLSERPVVVVPG